MTTYADAITTIEQIQLKYNWGPGEPYFAMLRDYLNHDPSSFWAAVNSLQWWGSAGSFADFSCGASDISQEESRVDEKRYRDALTSIGQGLLASDLSSPNAASWLSVFQQWRELGV